MIKHKILESITSNALVPSDSIKAASVGLALNIFSGFKFKLPDSLELVTNQYSSYNAYNREVSNCILRTQRHISIQGIRELSKINTYSVSVISNTLLIKLIDKYTLKGGLFTLFTPLGVLNNLGLEQLSCNFEEGNPNPIFFFNLLQLNIVDDGIGRKSLRASLCL